jgi:hypothetical protein
MLLILLASCRSTCPPGEIRRDDQCTTFSENSPVQTEGLWKAEPSSSWQIQYTGQLDTRLDVQMYDLDLFDTPKSVWTGLNGPAKVCYFSAGSYEDWRPDADQFEPSMLGKALEGWPGEWWLDINRSDVRAIMEARLDLAVQRGCDAVDPDNVNAWENPSGLNITEDEQVDYNRFLADAAHERGLAIGLKNDQLQLDRLADWFDFAVNEECLSYDECEAYHRFVEQKAVYQIEYVDTWEEAEALAADRCPRSGALSTLIKTWELGAERLACGEG